MVLSTSGVPCEANLTDTEVRSGRDVTTAFLSLPDKVRRGHLLLAGMYTK